MEHRLYHSPVDSPPFARIDLCRLIATSCLSPISRHACRLVIIPRLIELQSVVQGSRPSAVEQQQNREETTSVPSRDTSSACDTRRACQSGSIRHVHSYLRRPFDSASRNLFFRSNFRFLRLRPIRNDQYPRSTRHPILDELFLPLLRFRSFCTDLSDFARLDVALDTRIAVGNTLSLSQEHTGSLTLSVC